MNPVERKKRAVKFAQSGEACCRVHQRKTFLGFLELFGCVQNESGINRKEEERRLERRSQKAIYHTKKKFFGNSVQLRWQH